MPQRVTSCLSAGGSISLIPTHIFTALSTLPLSTDDGLATALLKPTGTSSPPTRRSSPIRCPDSIYHHTPFMSTSAFMSLSTTRRWQLHFAPPRPLIPLLSSHDKRSTESGRPIYNFFLWPKGIRRPMQVLAMMPSDGNCLRCIRSYIFGRDQHSCILIRICRSVSSAVESLAT